MCAPKESGGHVHPESAQLGCKSGHNDSRDFWVGTDISVVPVLALKTFFHFDLL